jgi:hypothetical protein
MASWRYQRGLREVAHCGAWWPINALPYRLPCCGWVLGEGVDLRISVTPVAWGWCVGRAWRRRLPIRQDWLCDWRTRTYL